MRISRPLHMNTLIESRSNIHEVISATLYITDAVDDGGGEKGVTSKFSALYSAKARQSQTNINKYTQISQSTSRHQEWTTKADRKVLVDYSKRYALRKLITHLTVSRSP